MSEIGRLRTRLRRTVLGATLLVLAQAAIGMAVNLDVAVPRSHPGAQPSDFFGGSFKSVRWAIGHGAVPLAIHAALGLVLVITVIAVAAQGLRLRNRAVAAWSVLAAAVVIGAGDRMTRDTNTERLLGLIGDTEGLLELESGR